MTLLLALLTAEILSAFELSMLYSAWGYLIEDFGCPVAVGWIITGLLLARAARAEQVNNGPQHFHGTVLTTVSDWSSPIGMCLVYFYNGNVCL